jgi:hypothetical protein
MDERARGILIEAIEVALAMAFLLAYIWFVEPRSQAYQTPGLVLFFTFTFLLHRRHGDTAADLGIRLDNFGPALGEALFVFAPALLLAFAAGLHLEGGGRLDARHIALSLLGGYPWALFQQYGLQSVIGRRLLGVVPHPIGHDVVCAVLFAALHLPNPLLTVVTFGAAYCFCALFRRCPNLFALAVVHTVASTVLYHSLPPVMTHLMRVGPGYFKEAGLF